MGHFSLVKFGLPYSRAACCICFGTQWTCSSSKNLAPWVSPKPFLMRWDYQPQAFQASLNQFPETRRSLVHPRKRWTSMTRLWWRHFRRTMMGNGRKPALLSSTLSCVLSRNTSSLTIKCNLFLTEPNSTEVVNFAWSNTVTSIADLIRNGSHEICMTVYQSI